MAVLTVNSERRAIQLKGGKENMIEQWRDIRGFEGRFQVSNRGEVRSLDRYIEYLQTNQHDKVGKVVRQFIKGRKLQPRKLGTGYLRVQLEDVDFYIHRLVVSNFIRPLKGKEEINHIDGNKSNNNLNNLEIVSRVENQDHAYHTGLNTYFEKSKKITVNSREYNSLGECSRETGIPTVTLSKALKMGSNYYSGRKYKFSIEECRD